MEITAITYKGLTPEVKSFNSIHYHMRLLKAIEDMLKCGYLATHICPATWEGTKVEYSSEDSKHHRNLFCEELAEKVVKELKNAGVKNLPVIGVE